MSKFYHSPATVVALVLANEGLVELPLPSGTPDWPVYVGHQPDAPDACVALFDSSPVNQGRCLSDGAVARLWGLQLRLRVGMKNYETGWLKISDIDNTLNGLHNIRVPFGDSTFTLLSIVPESGPMFIGRDEENRRPEFTLNFLANLTQS